MGKRRLLIIAAAMWWAASGASTAWAWGASGHSTVAEIAQRHLAPITKRRLAALLGANQSLASVGSWADTHAVLHPETRRWHFVNIPVGAAGYDPVRDCSTPREGDCLVAAIDRVRRTLGDRRARHAERLDALRLLVHLVADAHQPLHCAERDGDGGGTRTIVKFFGAPMPLHLVWDFGVLDRQTFDWGEHVRQSMAWLEKQSAGDIAVLARMAPLDWIMESHRLAVSTAYDLPADQNIAEAYQERGLPIIHVQLAKAGVRLAAVLTQALGPGGSLPRR